METEQIFPQRNAFRNEHLFLFKGKSRMLGQVTIPQRLTRMSQNDHNFNSLQLSKPSYLVFMYVKFRGLPSPKVATCTSCHRPRPLGNRWPRRGSRNWRPSSHSWDASRGERPMGWGAIQFKPISQHTTKVVSNHPVETIKQDYYSLKKLKNPTMWN